MKKGEYLDSILRSDKTVFSTTDILLIWGESGSNAAKARVNYYASTGKLYRIRRGFYAKDKNYNSLELATKIFTPSYIGFETVLGKSGITFQYYGETVFVASCTTREVRADNVLYSYRRMKGDILTNTAGVESKEHYAIATPERAFLDTLYLTKNYYFDNLTPLNWDKVDALLPVYRGNKRMKKQVAEYRDFVNVG